MKALIILIVLNLASRIEAQTNQSIITTNFLTAAHEFREVNGKLYNSARSYLFASITGEPVGSSTNPMLVQTFYNEPIRQAVVERHQNFASGIPTGRYHDEVKLVDVGSKEVIGQKIFLYNYPVNTNSLIGKRIHFRAIQIGTTNYEDERLALFDCGKPHVVMVVSTNFVPVSTK